MSERFKSAQVTQTRLTVTTLDLPVHSCLGAQKDTLKHLVWQRTTHSLWAMALISEYCSLSAEILN